MDRFYVGPAAGLVAQLALLALLTATAGLGGVGWVVGAAYGLGVYTALTIALQHAGRNGLNPADHVTLARATLTGGVAALVVDPGRTSHTIVAVVALAAIALLLDGVDGQVARRTGTESPLGARFDMEVDASLILALSILAALSLGPWVLAIGAMRYAFLAASRPLPWLAAELPHSMARKTVAAMQGILLVIAVCGLLPVAVSAAVAALALGTLTWSFTRDIRWLYVHRPVPVRVRPAAPQLRPATALPERLRVRYASAESTRSAA